MFHFKHENEQSSFNIKSMTKKTCLYNYVFVDTGNKSVGCNHKWLSVRSGEGQCKASTVCVVCGNCSEKGLSCESNGIASDSPHHCLCRATRTCCADCGICLNCADNLWVSLFIFFYILKYLLIHLQFYDI